MLRKKEVVMKAAVCYEFNKPLVIEEVDIDPPQKGEVSVTIFCVQFAWLPPTLTKPCWRPIMICTGWNRRYRYNSIAGLCF
jgi:hypothetical protein